LHALLSDRPLPPAPTALQRPVTPSGNIWRPAWPSATAPGGGTSWTAWTPKLSTNSRPIAAAPPFPAETRAAPIVERLDGATVAALTRLARAQQVGLHALLLTLLAAEARRRDGRRSVIVGTGISVRPPGAERAVGYFVNVPPVILTATDAQPLAAQIRSTQAALNDAVEHGGYPASLLYREFRQRHPHARDSRTSLYDISLTSNPSRSTGDVGAAFRLTPGACRGGGPSRRRRRSRLQPRAGRGQRWPGTGAAVRSRRLPARARRRRG
jgi:hypothetical protein